LGRKREGERVLRVGAGSHRRRSSEDQKKKEKKLRGPNDEIIVWAPFFPGQREEGREERGSFTLVLASVVVVRRNKKSLSLIIKMK
jgi:hypothetical protein